MTLQLALSFGHLHLERLSSGSGIASVAASKPGKIQLSIRRTRRTIIARSAQTSISPRHRFCRMRRSCRCRSRRERSSISDISRSFLFRRSVRHFNRALLRSPDSRSLLI
jgi:hypothetical protein